MIVRILGEGQFDVDDAQLDALNVLDAAVEASIEAGDEPAFVPALTALLDSIRSEGTALADDALATSDLILPHADADMGEVRDMLAEDGLIPG